MSTLAPAPIPGEDRPGVLASLQAEIVRSYRADQWFHSTFNRAIDMAYVVNVLAPSIQSQGQLKPGVGCEGPDGTYECLIGNHTLAACRMLGIEFKARILTPAPDNPTKIKIITTDNLKQKRMTEFDIADALRNYIRESGCPQGVAAALMDIDEAVASRAMTVDQGLIPELRQLQVGTSFRYLIATLPPELQLQAAARLPMKRDAFAKYVATLKGKPERKAKKVKHKDEIGQIEFRANIPREQIIDWLTKKLGELKKGVL